MSTLDVWKFTFSLNLIMNQNLYNLYRSKPFIMCYNLDEGNP